MTAPICREARAEEARTLAEFQVALALETEALALDPETCRRGVSAVLNDPAKGRFYVAELDGAVAASLMITYEWSDWFNGQIWWIQSVYIPPRLRGRKIFSELYGFIEALAARDAEARGLRLYVDKKNLSAQKVYAALGMTDEHYALFEKMKPFPPETD